MERRLSSLGADLHRMGRGAGMRNLMFLFIFDRAFRPLVTIRIYQHIQRWRFAAIFKPPLTLAHKMLTQLAGMDLPLATPIGPGFNICHGWGLVVTKFATIGSNVTVFHGVTIGQGDHIAPDGHRTTGYPVIGDDVWIGPGAVIVGDVRIGSGCRILANAVVTRHLPERAIFAGNPGSIIRENCVPDVPNAVDLHTFATRSSAPK